MPAPSAPPPAFADITPAQWQALAARRVYFGHQSVGGNIMDGVQAVLSSRPDIPLRVIEARELDSSGTPGIYHARIGANGDPASKTRAFEDIADAGHPAIGALKYCYVDVDGRTDPDSLFRAYAARMAHLRARHPDLTIVHVTMPLTTIDGPLQSFLDRVRRTTSRRALNVIRNRYNELLRAAYAGREPVFDLARIEATRADGSRAAFRSGGHAIDYLAPELTDDGGHLNEAGRRAAAEAFLALLASLPGPQH